MIYAKDARALQKVGIDKRNMKLKAIVAPILPWLEEQIKSAAETGEEYVDINPVDIYTHLGDDRPDDEKIDLMPPLRELLSGFGFDVGWEHRYLPPRFVLRISWKINTLPIG